MAEQQPRPGTTEYSSSQARETQEAAQKPREDDYRAIPGGHPSRATAALGMESPNRVENETISDNSSFADARERATSSRAGQE